MIIGLPRFARDHARASSAYVFRDSLLGCGVDIQAGQVYGYVHRRTVLQPARLVFHWVPRCFLGRGVGVNVEVGSTAAKSYPLNPEDGQEVSFRVNSYT